MTAFNPGTNGDLPATVTTVESLLVWAIRAMYQQYQGIEYREFAGSSEGIFQRVFYNVQQVEENNATTVIGRFAFTLDNDYGVDPNKRFWEHVVPLGNMAIPDLYKRSA